MDIPRLAPCLLLSLLVLIGKVEAGCRHNGRTYAFGAVFMDDCNRCRCMSNGVAACTKKGCPRFCVEHGLVLEIGQTFSPDGCSTCRCMPGGFVTCNNRACPPNWHQQTQQQQGR